MDKFDRLTAPACPLPVSNVDTDQLIPARFMKRTRAQGYGEQLLHDLRRDGQGTLRTDLALNDPARAGARILVARRNFGGGSSREAAAYALVDAGFRCVIAPSFGDIFAANAVNNGLVPARIGEAEAEDLLARLAEGPGELTVDLETCTIVAGNRSIPFTIAPTWRTRLLNGWDDIQLTLAHQREIAAFAAARAAAFPWSLPGLPDWWGGRVDSPACSDVLNLRQLDGPCARWVRPTSDRCCSRDAPSPAPACMTGSPPPSPNRRGSRRSISPAPASPIPASARRISAWCR